MAKGPNRAQRVAAHPAVRTARRVWPLVLAAKQRWNALTPEQQERVRQTAREYARRGQQTVRRRGRR